jgi:hypothetical protein
MRRFSFNGTPILTNSFRNTSYMSHLGEDYALVFRTAIYAKADGKVIIAKGDETRQWIANTPSDPFARRVLGKIVTRPLTSADYGNYIKIYHGKDGMGRDVHTLYAHLHEIKVYVGQYVTEGELIGYSDSIGNSTGNHIHEEIRINDKVVNPNTFDYKFNGKGGENKPVHKWQGTVTVTVPTLYVRSAPARIYQLAGSKEIHKGNVIKVDGYIEGENINGNNIWFRSIYGNYFWSGGTDKAGFRVPQADTQSITREEIELKNQEFEGKKAHLEAKQRELEAEFDTYKAEFEQFVADSVIPEEAPVETIVEEVAEEAPAVVEEVVEEAVAEEVEEQPVVDDEVKQELSKLAAMIEELRAKLGL